MRKPNLKPPDLNRPAGRETIQLTIRLATPMLGGGTTAMKVDDAYPIRASAIRGALRHWWRATCGFTYATDREMRDAEASLFGAASGDKGQPGKVAIRVTAVRNMRAKTLEEIVSTVPPYSIGLFTPRSILNEIECLTEAEFDLEVTCPHERLSEVSAALSCWIAYGGLGARSRRGFGSLELVSGDCEKRAIPTAARPTSANEFSLAQAQLFCGRPCDCNKAWTQSVAAYASFRKGERPGTTRPNTGPLSHTPWPEADDYRVSMGKSPLRSRGSERGVVRAPRASLGLPLQLRSLPAHSGSFGKFDLSGNEDRLASSIITKPVYHSGSWHPGILVVHRPVKLPRVAGVQIKPAGDPVGFFDGTKYEPLPRAFGSASELMAFYLSEYAKWEEVPLR